MQYKDLAAAIIHDLKNQLQSVLLEGERALADIPEQYHEPLRPLLGRTRRVHQDAMQLVTLYRLNERGNFPSDDAWPADTIRHSIECFDSHFPDVQIDVDISGECQGYYNDFLIQMGISNLLGNSAQAGATRIQIAAEETDQGLMIRIRDNGPGFPEGFLSGDKIATGDFETDKVGGTGLGLYFTQLMVEHHSTPAKKAEMRLSNHGDVSADGGAQAEILLP